MKPRTTAELLERLRQHCEVEYYTPGLGDWHWAALAAIDLLEKRLLLTT